jgi:hypothetical protein
MSLKPSYAILANRKTFATGLRIAVLPVCGAFCPRNVTTIEAAKWIAQAEHDELAAEENQAAN